MAKRIVRSLISSKGRGTSPEKPITREDRGKIYAPEIDHSKKPKSPVKKSTRPTKEKKEEVRKNLRKKYGLEGGSVQTWKDVINRNLSSTDLSENISAAKLSDLLKTIENKGKELTRPGSQGKRIVDTAEASLRGNPKLRSQFPKPEDFEKWIKGTRVKSKSVAIDTAKTEEVDDLRKAYRIINEALKKRQVKTHKELYKDEVLKSPPTTSEKLKIKYKKAGGEIKNSSRSQRKSKSRGRGCGKAERGWGCVTRKGVT